MDHPWQTPEGHWFGEQVLQPISQAVGLVRWQSSPKRDDDSDRRLPHQASVNVIRGDSRGGRGVVDGVAENRVGRILGCHRVNVVSGTARAEQGAVQRKVHTVSLFLTLNVGTVVPNPQANVFTCATFPRGWPVRNRPGSRIAS